MSDPELNEYIRLYRSTVFRVAFNYVKNPEDAEDISQEAFLKLYRTEQHFHTSENVKAWLIRVTINLSKNMLRSAWYRQRSELTTDIPDKSGAADDLHDLHSAIQRLKPDYAGVLYLFYYEGYSVKETARLCGITGAAVRTRLSRARAMLKELLSEEEEA